MLSLLLVPALAAGGVSAVQAVPDQGTAVPGYYTTKTPYQPQQDAHSYEAPPVGYLPVYTELVARHGSRGLSSMQADDAMLNMWEQAKADGELTPLGQRLGPDLEALIRANLLLGYGVAGVSHPGYGNLTQIGIRDHQQLAARLAQRQAALFATAGGRQVQVLNSGVDRAADSSQAFAASLAQHAPQVAAHIAASVTDRDLLYFHKLKHVPAATAGADEALQTEVFRASQAYQVFLAGKDTAGFGAEVSAKLAAMRTSPQVKAAARAVLERLFSPAFVDRIESGAYTFSNNSTRQAQSADGRFANTARGNGKSRIRGVVDAAASLYSLYAIAPCMRDELGLDFSPYMPAEQARVFAELQDMDEFYRKGPSATEYGGLTYRMALGLQQDFFNEVDRIAAGDLSRVARLRFAHAEILMPFAAILGIREAATPVLRAQTFSYASNPWRGALVSPMAANVQWDVYRNGQDGSLIVKMYLNEREVDFKPACDNARHAAGSHFYDYARLRACYLAQ